MTNKAKDALTNVSYQVYRTQKQKDPGFDNWRLLQPRWVLQGLPTRNAQGQFTRAGEIRPCDQSCPRRNKLLKAATWGSDGLGQQPGNHKEVPAGRPPIEGGNHEDEKCSYPRLW